MGHLDLASLRFVSAIELLILPSLLWAFLRPRRGMTAMRTWIVAGWVMCAGNLLVLQRDLFAAPGMDLVTRLVFVTYLVLRIQSFRLDLGIALRATPIALAYGAYVIAHELVRRLVDWPAGLATFTSIVTTLLTVELARLALRIARTERSRSALWIAGGLGLYTLLFLARVVALVTGQTPIDQLGPSLTNDAIGLAVVLIPIVEHMGYLGICIERSRRAERTAVSNLSAQAQIDAMRQQIAILDRRRSMGEMAAALGHEIKQPLTAVLTSAQTAEIGLASGRIDAAQLRGLLAVVVEGVRRSNALLERFHTFVRPATPSFRSLDLNEVAREALALAGGSIKSARVHCQAVYVADGLVVRGDPLQLSQVVLNLVRNGIEATESSAPRELRLTSLRRGDHAVLTLRDNGPGFAASILKQVGTPFVTTKENGMGMGLAIAQSIAQQHHGTLTFANAPDGGAEVSFALPLETSPQAAAKPS